MRAAMCCLTSTISILAPREGGDLGGAVDVGQLLIISILAPREGGDWEGVRFLQLANISILAPREGGD